MVIITEASTSSEFIFLSSAGEEDKDTTQSASAVSEWALTVFTQQQCIFRAIEENHEYTVHKLKTNPIRQSISC